MSVISFLSSQLMRLNHGMQLLFYHALLPWPDLSILQWHDTGIPLLPDPGTLLWSDPAMLLWPDPRDVAVARPRDVAVARPRQEMKKGSISFEGVRKFAQVCLGFSGIQPAITTKRNALQPLNHYE